MVFHHLETIEKLRIDHVHLKEGEQFVRGENFMENFRG